MIKKIILKLLKNGSWFLIIGTFQIKALQNVVALILNNIQKRHWNNQFQVAFEKKNALMKIINAL
jgi:hypothetical protein